MNPVHTSKFNEHIEETSLLFQAEIEALYKTGSLTSIISFLNSDNNTIDRDSKSKEKILSLIIKIKDKAKERIDLYEGDKLNEIALNIIQKYELENEDIELLKNVIIGNITQLIAERQQQKDRSSNDGKACRFTPDAIEEKISEEGSENIDDGFEEIILTKIIKQRETKEKKLIQGSGSIRKRSIGEVCIEKSKTTRKKNTKLTKYIEANTRNSLKRNGNKNLIHYLKSNRNNKNTHQLNKDITTFNADCEREQNDILYLRREDINKLKEERETKSIEKRKGEKGKNRAIIKIKSQSIYN